MSRHRRAAIASVAVLALFAAACGSDDDASPADTAPPPTQLDDTDGAPATDPPATDPAATDPPASEPADAPTDNGRGAPLQVTAVSFETGVATLTNTGDEPYDLSGHWICNRPSYAELGSTVIEPGGTFEASLGGFNPGGGEVAIYSSDAFGSSDDIVAYVGWGSGGGRQSVAEDAGIWVGDPVQPTGTEITLTGQTGSAAGWTG